VNEPLAIEWAIRHWSLDRPKILARRSRSHTWNLLLRKRGGASRRVRQFFGSCRLIVQYQRRFLAIFSTCCNPDTVIRCAAAFRYLSAWSCP